MQAFRVKVIRVGADRRYVLRWTDPATGRVRQRQTPVVRRDQAQRLAADLERELADGLIDDGRMRWDAFRARYQRERLAGLSEAYQGQWRTAANRLELSLGARLERLHDVTASALSRFAANLRDEGKSSATIAAYLRALRAALRWAESIELVDRAPRFAMPRRSGRRAMRSRPVTGEEFDRILAAVPLVRPRDAARWERFLQGLWHSGLRVGELLDLSWHPAADCRLEYERSPPLICFAAEAHKRRVDQFQPITPEFWELVKHRRRAGAVFPMPGRKAAQMTVKRVIRIIGDIGGRARVVTDPHSGKFATSHDIGRRAFATRLAAILPQTSLSAWMRHRSAQTTLDYYLADDAEALAAQLWSK